MAVSELGARLWHSLGMGPLWRERAANPQPMPPAESPPEPAQLNWDGLERAVAACTACGLSRTRTQTVFSAGSRSATWMFIGEAPGAEEDARGEPFVGQAGRLLDNMLAAIGLGRERTGEQAVFIANVLKCRPPGNRNPEGAEVAACAPFLRRQIELLHPRIIVVMGRFAVQSILATDASIASLRGRIHEVAVANDRYPVIVTYHPAYLLRNLADKAKVWEDLCFARGSYTRIASRAERVVRED
ncbi:MAG TPA: uracil-DNA glycosylase [Burkholderiaceae bacterium]|nr:uracil-DNA glycosylase [Burkholderiaceae bacterium]